MEGEKEGEEEEVEEEEEGEEEEEEGEDDGVDDDEWYEDGKDDDLEEAELPLCARTIEVVRIDQLYPSSLKKCNEIKQEQHNLLQPQVKEEPQQDKLSLDYPCDQCDKAFKDKIKLERHKLYLHSKNAVKPFACNICEKRFWYSRDLKRHNLRHKFQCKLCSKTFQEKTALEQHVLELHPTHPYICKQCCSCFLLHWTCCSDGKTE